MAKIILIAENVKIKITFIKNIRPITGESISKIKKSIRDKTPIFEGIVRGGENENLERVKKIFLVTSTKSFSNINQNDELTLDMLNNWIESVEDTRRHLEEMDELFDE